MAPYRGAGRRAGVGNFVADIPADASHPSFPALTSVAEGLRGLKVPALMLWGPRDPIFSDRYLKDLISRLPHAEVHRFEGAGHLVAEDRDIATPVFEWLAEHGRDQRTRRCSGDDSRLAGANADAGLLPTDCVAHCGVRRPRFRPLWDPLGRAGGRTRQAPTPPSRKWRRTARVSRSLSWRQLEHNIAGPGGGAEGSRRGTRQPGQPDGSARAWT